MKKFSLALVVVLAISSLNVKAQSVDEIVSGYFENTGGKEAWGALEGIKLIAKVNQNGIEFPLEIVQMADGRQYTKVTFQGNEFKQGVFDGETLWSTNFQTMKAEKSDAEATGNQKLEANDFPDALYNYQDKGYTVELMGTETIDGAETYKIKVVKEPMTVDGQEVEDISYYFFDTETYVPIAQESQLKQGPAKGTVMQIKMSDYQEVDGLYFPFSMSQGTKGGQSQPLMIDSIELNPEVSTSDFAFPEE
ncbi:MAG: outer membrane lipoprotein-sorting protein [Cyclobacteriaceae bacterium]|nr:outer membrane lipoprotein-sorting protein [Cyclobacteriaceae bacterium]